MAASSMCPAGPTSAPCVWVDRQGREESLALAPAAYEAAAVSPDGSRVVVEIADQQNADVWVSEVGRGTLSRVTNDPARDRRPLWAPDGQRVVFESNREGPVGLFWKNTDGTGEAERLMTSDATRGLRPYSWSPDGETLLFFHGGPGGGDIGTLSMEGERTWELLIGDNVRETHPALSPDGAWLAYSSGDTGQEEVYVQRYPSLGGRRQISTGGGNQPVWSPDGGELFYRSLDGTGLMVVPIDTEPAFTPGDPELVFEGQYFNRAQRTYDISPDGRRFLMIKTATQGDGDASPDIIVVQNWHQELLERVPGP